MTAPSVMWLQASLNAVTHARLVVDGILGPSTEAAILRLSEAEWRRLSSAASTLGIALPRISTDSRVVEVPVGMLSHSDLLHCYADAEAAFGVPLNHLRQLVEVEAEQLLINGELYFNPRSRLGSHHGLTQMGEMAWQDAQEFASNRGVFLKDFSLGRYDPCQSILAAAAYSARWVAHHARLVGDRPPFAVRYALHNQGPSFFTRLREGKGGIAVEAQSPLAQRLLREASEFV